MFRLHIKRRGRVVEHQNRAVLCQCARNADPLLLSARKSDTALPDDSLVLFIHLLNEPACFGILCREAHRLHLKFLALSHLDVLLDRIREKEHILQNNRDVAAELMHIHLSHIHTVNLHRAVRHIVKPLEQIDDGGFAGAGRPHDTERLSCRNGNIDVLQNLLPVHDKVSVVKTDLSPDFVKHLWMLVVFDLRLLRINLADLLIRCYRGRHIVRQPAQHLHRPGTVPAVLHKRHQRTQCHLTVHDKNTAQDRRTNRKHLSHKRKQRVILCQYLCL